MGLFRIAVYLVPFVPFLYPLPAVVAAAYASDQSTSWHSQLTVPAEQQRPLRRPDARYGTLQEDTATAAAAHDVVGDLRKALDVMQNEWFEVWVGTWPTAIDWTRAVVDTHLIAAAGTLSKALHGSRGDKSTDQHDAKDVENDINQYFAQNIAYYFGENAFSLRNQAYDDMLWVVLGWLESIKFIKAHSRLHYPSSNEGSKHRQAKTWHGSQFIAAFAHRARIFWEITTNGWDTTLCGGGMVWNPSLGPYKNAITNELFISASVGMYLYFPGDNNTSPFAVDGSPEADSGGRFDERYLDAAIVAYDWLKNSNMTNAKGLYVDGFHVRNWRNGGTKCNIRNEMVYTYNQGVLLSGLRGLWESTGNRSYLEDGHQLARNAIRATGWGFENEEAPDPTQWAGLGRGGILEDRCDATGHCNQDGEMFKGIYMHHLTLLCEPLPLRPVVPGKTYCADKELAALHKRSCKQYSRWVAHNAKAALQTRDEKGRFGNWWKPRADVSAESLPLGAIDYRNNVTELLRESWAGSWASAVSDYNSGRILLPSEMEPPCSQRPMSTRDENDRGRGRTVEIQSGGVAVLHALWELQSSR